MADLLEALLADPGRRARLGRRGRTLVTERFRWTDTVEGTTDRLAELTTD
jgi:glycosyltransferase involved in cell wall biosynthesis